MLKRLSSLKTLPRSLESSYGAGLQKYVKFLYYSVFRINTFVVMFADRNSMPGYADTVQELDWKEISLKSLDSYRQGKQLPREYHVDEMGWSRRCFGVWEDGAPCHIHWVHQGKDHSRFLRLGDADAEINHIVTMPGQRGKGLCAKAIRLTLRQLFDEGVERVYSVVHSENVASCKALAKAGMRPLMTLHSIGPFNLKTRPCVAGQG